MDLIEFVRRNIDLVEADERLREVGRGTRLEPYVADETVIEPVSEYLEARRLFQKALEQVEAQFGSDT